MSPERKAKVCCLCYKEISDVEINKDTLYLLDDDEAAILDKPVCKSCEGDLRVGGAYIIE